MRDSSTRRGFWLLSGLGIRRRCQKLGWLFPQRGREEWKLVEGRVVELRMKIREGRDAFVRLAKDTVGERRKRVAVWP